MKHLFSLLAIGLAPFLLFAQDCNLVTYESRIFDLFPQEQGCGAIVYAHELIESDLSDCAQPLSYAIYFEEEVNEAGFSPEFTSTTAFKLFDNCDALAHDVRIYVQDANGVILDAPSAIWIVGNSCDAYCRIVGSVQTETGTGINNVSFQIGNQEETTDAAGFYDLDHLNCCSSVGIGPYKNTGALNGVTTLDLVLISKHILGVDLLDSPYKMLAADANKSGTITTIDMIMLRRLILNIIQEFPDNTSWRFVKADYVFPAPLNPWIEEVPEICILNQVIDLDENVDFIGFKVGDVNNSADPSL